MDLHKKPIRMEEYFSPGLKVAPAVHIGSQTVDFFHGSIEYQAWEAFHVAAAHENDLVVVRDLDPDYITYWKSIIGNVHIINILGQDRKKFLSEVLLSDESVISEIKNKMSSGAKLVVFLPTSLEEQLSQRLGIPLHGSSKVTRLYGIKSGMRSLAQDIGITMPPGFICSSVKETSLAINALREKFERIVIKHDDSVSGMFSKKLLCKKGELITEAMVTSMLNDILERKFIPGRDIFVVEGWIKNNVSIGAHIEILEGKEPIICAAWQQVIDADGISYMGAAPLTLSYQEIDSLMVILQKLAIALQARGAVGSFGPDFILSGDDEQSLEPNAWVLIELNTRAPMTAVPLEIVKQIKGEVGNSFFATHVTTPYSMTFSSVKELLDKEKLLITKKNNDATGVVPYNVGILPWKKFDIVAMANSWEETLDIVQKTKRLFSNA